MRRISCAAGIPAFREAPGAPHISKQPKTKHDRRFQTVMLLLFYPRISLKSFVAAADFSVMRSKFPELTASFGTIQLPPTA